MPDSRFERQLEKYGPESPHEPCSLAAATDYCQHLTKSHYENFTVASWLLPRELRPHFAHVYAYCRWSDDLADEVGEDQRSLDLLAWWRGELEACYQGKAWHPVFVALSETIREYQIPIDPFANLLIAFEQDQRVKCYGSHQQLLSYCENSANPVGHLVLYLGRSFRPETRELSDSICTGLQLANFWQDVARDYAIGRIYLPEEDRRKFGVTEEMIAAKSASAEFRQLLQFEVERAENYLRSGRPLINMIAPQLRLDVELFLAGGLAICQAIRQQKFDVLQSRPTVGKWKKLQLLLGCWTRRTFSRNAKMSVSAGQEATV
ncbi:squalene synthase HpnC [Blastopirellula sp. JC732]|uniref:Squalene synthase HpnC n=1 Tax=Blastopirellula sediminis TaxID=2894196 RepID=A0A9X1SHV4_9BACT|nr:squalene synthase HpnC [Blastopirellula sediminis]MCC9605055.1 squalene synthase HpnC [Blastopirellula sediminis]MCC9631645.1 squalene synthase HpnC [Blastopirellula sediminis]